jgi:hypothetical protein
MLTHPTNMSFPGNLVILIMQSSHIRQRGASSRDLLERTTPQQRNCVNKNLKATPHRAPSSVVN